MIKCFLNAWKLEQYLHFFYTKRMLQTASVTEVKELFLRVRNVNSVAEQNLCNAYLPGASQWSISRAEDEEDRLLPVGQQIVQLHQMLLWRLKNDDSLETDVIALISEVLDDLDMLKFENSEVCVVSENAVTEIVKKMSGICFAIGRSGVTLNPMPLEEEQ